MVTAAPPSDTLEEKVYHDMTIIRTPIQEPQIKLVLFREHSPYVGDNRPPIYRIGIKCQLEQSRGKSFLRRTEFIESFGSNESAAREAYQHYQAALDSGKAYLIEDEEKGLRIALALDNKTDKHHY